LCFASPKAQVDPGRPATYAVDQSYGQVTSSTVTSDGVVHGGDTIANTHANNIKMGVQGKTPAVVKAANPNTKARPAKRSDYMAAGANIRM
jgi:hypothetical protein